MRSATQAAAVLLALLGLAACRQPGSTVAVGDRAPRGVSPVGPSAAGAPPAVRHAAYVYPSRKYFGVSLAGTPQSWAPYDEIAGQLGKAPNLLSYFQDWSHPFDPIAAQRTCDAAVVPALTWESWSWADRVAGQTAVSQAAYAPSVIAAGQYDSYIRSTARAIKSLHCTMMLRFDQEPNGHWYPWGLATPGMNNSARDYIAMWRHVWRVFERVGATNVVWVWCPNLLFPGGLDRLRALYPGDRYVDVVGIDGYLRRPQDTVSSVLGPIMRRLKTVAPGKPWLVAETGVAPGQRRPARLSALLRRVANSQRLIGFVYLNEEATNVNWRVTSDPAAIEAFRRGVASPVFGSARTSR